MFPSQHKVHKNKFKFLNSLQEMVYFLPDTDIASKLLASLQLLQWSKNFEISGRQIWAIRTEVDHQYYGRTKTLA